MTSGGVLSRRRLLLLAAAAGALPAAACTEILPGGGDPPRLFSLSPKSTFPEDLPQVDWQLVVDVPVSAASLNISRIALSRQPMSLDYYAQAAWTDVAPAMVQTLIIESFENTDRIVSVGRESSILRSDYLLLTELREFQAEYRDGSTAPSVNVRIVAKLVRMPQRVIIDTRSFENQVEAEADNLDAIVTAWDDALGRVLKHMVVWALRAPFEA